MLGDQITELKGKVTGQRVLDSEGPPIETSASSTGSAKGVRINEIVTFVAKPHHQGFFMEKHKGCSRQNQVWQHGQVRELEE